MFALFRPRKHVKINIMENNNKSDKKECEALDSCLAKTDLDLVFETRIFQPKQGTQAINSADILLP
jgi:hypothetical protein